MHSWPLSATPPRLILVKCIRPFVTAILAVVLLVAAADATSSRWRLTRALVLAIAEQAMTAKHFDLSKYPQRIVKQRQKKHQWTIVFAPPMPAAIDSDVLVVVSDETGEAKVYYGV